MEETRKKCITGIISGEGTGSVYPIRINVKYKDFIKNTFNRLLSI